MNAFQIGIGDLFPAFGRDYKNKKQIQEDFDANKDFVDSVSDRYVNKSQLKELGVTRVMVRYAKKTKLTDIKVS